MNLKRMSRRDKCYLVGRRAHALTPSQAATAWAYLAGQLEEMGEIDVPKFQDLLSAIRAGTLHARKTNLAIQEPGSANLCELANPSL